MYVIMYCSFMYIYISLSLYIYIYIYDLGLCALMAVNLELALSGTNKINKQIIHDNKTTCKQAQHIEYKQTGTQRYMNSNSF